MMKNRYFTAIKIDDEWERTDKRGYGDLDFARFNAQEIANKNGGQDVAILFRGEVKEIVPANPILAILAPILKQLNEIVRGENE